MPFHSLEFLFFFAAVFLIHWGLPRRFRNVFLLLASYFYYSTWGISLLAILLSLSALSYAGGIWIAQSEPQTARQGRLLLTIAAHLIPLAYFKAAPSSVNGPQHWAIPLGLSYYSFQSMAYLIDIYRGSAPCRNPVIHALFLSFFPQLMIGPIERAHRLLPQIQSQRPWAWERFQEGCHLFFWGFFQKIFIADNLAIGVARIFDGPSADSSALATLLAIYAFAFQLFADFSGYSDMARGLGKCLGFELSINFNAPFLATSLLDFWKRWHMSLSSWFSDYIYRPLLWIPLPFKFYIAPIITLALMGLWHGFQWKMLWAGIYFGILTSASLWLQSRRPENAGWLWLKRLLTFHAVCLGLIFLRADSMEQIFYLLQQLSFAFVYTADADGLLKSLFFFAAPAVAAQCWQYARKSSGGFMNAPLFWRSAAYVLMFYALILFGNDANLEYVYAQF